MVFVKRCKILVKEFAGWATVVKNNYQQRVYTFPFRPVRNCCWKSQSLNHFNWEHDYNLCYSSINQHWNCFFSIWDWVCNHRQENVGTFISFHVYILCKNVVNWIGARRWWKIITNKGCTPSPLGQCVIVVEKAKV